MLKAINSTHVKQECAGCGTERDVPFTAIKVGAGAKDMIRFPECGNCGAIEWGQREREQDDPAAYDSKVNGAINVLHRKALEGEQWDDRIPPKKDDLDALKAERSKGRWPGRKPKRVIEPADSTWVDLTAPDPAPEPAQPPEPPVIGE